jgi:two-component sensor histidine kinase
LIVEEPSTPSPRDELPYRLKQQQLLAEFGRMALRTEVLGSLLQRATELCAQGLETRFCKVLEYIESRNLLLLRAGVGWSEGEIGHVTLGADLESPSGFAFHTRHSVLSNHLQKETRFRTPKLLADHGIKRAVNVFIDLGGRNHGPFGVLEVDSANPGKFDEADVTFLTGFAGILGAAIERHRGDLKLQASLERQALLTREMSHRVKNSLSVAGSLLRLGAANLTDDAAKGLLGAAEHRVATIAKVHDHLWRGEKVGEIDLGAFVRELCSDLDETVVAVRIECNADPSPVNNDYAIPVGLIVNELVTNALKYAYEPEQSGTVEVALRRGDTEITLSVTDFGKGLPADFDIHAPRKSFGLRVIASLIRQINGTMEAQKAQTGTRISVRFSPTDNSAR